MSLSRAGYGNLVPTTEGAKVFVCFYILVGLNLFAIGVGYVAAALATSSKKPHKCRHVNECAAR